MTTFTDFTSARGATALLALMLGGSAAESAEPLLDVAQQFRVRGTGYGTVAGHHCCGDTRFTGRFDASYTVDSAGVARLGALSVSFDDVDVTVHDGFLGMFNSRASIRCASARSEPEATGELVEPNRIKFPADAIRFSGLSSEGRHADGTCLDPTIGFSGVNNDSTAVAHDPLGDRFALEGTFGMAVEGHGYTLTLRMDGRYLNRPPTAAFVLNPGEEPGCPRRGLWDGVEMGLVEANDPSGLIANPSSLSSDVDGGARPNGDVFGERWFYAREDEGREFLGQGRWLKGLALGWKTLHRLELLAVDHAGAASAANCEFVVVDTLAPVVTPPGPLTLACTTAGGATAATSPELTAFLGGGAAVDRADRAPRRLAPRLAGARVTTTTLFPADNVARPITFSFSDLSDNIGHASASVLVRDMDAPRLAAVVSPTVLPADRTWRPIHTTITTSDNCGGRVTLRLVSIRSNAPGLDASDVSGAEYGTADVDYQLFTRPGPSGSRAWTITYEATDQAGNRSLARAFVSVR